MGTEPTIVHLLASYQRHEYQGRAVFELAARAPGRHVLLCAELGHGVTDEDLAPFADVRQVGGLQDLFPFRQHRGIRAGTADADVVHLHGGPFALFADRFVADKPTVATLYGWPRLPGPAATVRALRASGSVPGVLRHNTFSPRVAASTLLRPRQVARAGRSLSAVLTADRVAAAQLGRLGMPVRFVPFGDTPVSAPPTWSPTPHIVQFGRGEEPRGYDVTVAALRLLRARGVNATVTFAVIPAPRDPTGPERIRDRYRNEPGVTVLVGRADLPALCATAQVAVFPFLLDYVTVPVALAALEAQAAGLPLVVSDVACLNGAVDGTTGRTVPVGDAAATAAAIMDLTADRPLWERTSAAALAAAAEHGGWDRHCLEAAKVWERAQRPLPHTIE